MKSKRPNDSFFVVMTDQSKLGSVRVDSSILNGATVSAVDAVTTHPTANNNNDDDDDEFFDNLPKRDEDDVSNDVSHVLLGGILIATPPRSEVTKHSPKNGNSNRSNRPFDGSDLTAEIGEQIETNAADNAIEESKQDVHRIVDTQDDCSPQCDAIQNEMCKLIDGIGRCVCRPGFARIFPDRPCKRKFNEIQSVFNLLIIFFIIFFS